MVRCRRHRGGPPPRPPPRLLTFSPAHLLTFRYLRKNQERVAALAIEAERAATQRDSLLKLLPPEERALRKKIFRLEDDGARLTRERDAQSIEGAQVDSLLRVTIKRNAELVDAVATLQGQVDAMRRDAASKKVAKGRRGAAGKNGRPKSARPSSAASARAAAPATESVSVRRARAAMTSRQLAASKNGTDNSADSVRSPVIASPGARMIARPIGGGGAAWESKRKGAAPSQRQATWERETLSLWEEAAAFEMGRHSVLSPGGRLTDVPPAGPQTSAPCGTEGSASCVAAIMSASEGSSGWDGGALLDDTVGGSAGLGFDAPSPAQPTYGHRGFASNSAAAAAALQASLSGAACMPEARATAHAFAPVAGAAPVEAAARATLASLSALVDSP